MGVWNPCCNRHNLSPFSSLDRLHSRRSCLAALGSERGRYQLGKHTSILGVQLALESRVGDNTHIALT